MLLKVFRGRLAGESIGTIHPAGARPRNKKKIFQIAGGRQIVSSGRG